MNKERLPTLDIGDASLFYLCVLMGREDQPEVCELVLMCKKCEEGVALSLPYLGVDEMPIAVVLGELKQHIESTDHGAA